MIEHLPGTKENHEKAIEVLTHKLDRATSEDRKDILRTRINLHLAALGKAPAYNTRPQEESVEDTLSVPAFDVGGEG